MLILIRGLPGSGKTTLAKRLLEVIPNSKHFEMNQYRINSDGEYNYDPTQNQNVANICKIDALIALEKGFTVIVSNTFTRRWEMVDYINYVIIYNIPYQIIECYSQFKSEHNVPNEHVQRMKDRWESVGDLYKLGV